jgi:hypothetical protein
MHLEVGEPDFDVPECVKEACTRAVMEGNTHYTHSLGDLRLRDVEDDDTAEVTISKPLLDKYKANLQAYCTELKEHCTRRGITYLFASTRVPFDVLVMSYLRQRGLLR